MSALLRTMRSLTPIGLWPLDETSGTTAYDASGGGHNGTYSGATNGSVARGNLLTYPDFDGADDYVSVPTWAGINNLQSSDFTACAWIHKDNSGEGTTGRIFNKRASGAGGGEGWVFFADDVASIGAQVPGLATTVAEARGADNAVPHSHWYFVSMWWTLSTRQITLFCNGVEIGYATRTSGAGAVSGDDSSGPLLIGNSSPGDRTFDGGIAYAALYSGNMSAANQRIITALGYRNKAVVG